MVFHLQAGTSEPTTEVTQAPVRSPETMQENDGFRPAPFSLVAVRQHIPPTLDYAAGLSPLCFAFFGLQRPRETFFLLNEPWGIAYSFRTFCRSILERERWLRTSGRQAKRCRISSRVRTGISKSPTTDRSSTRGSTGTRSSCKTGSGSCGRPSSFSCARSSPRENSRTDSFAPSG